MSAEEQKAYNTASWWDIGIVSMSTYMIWVVLYYIKVSNASILQKPEFLGCGSALQHVSHGAFARQSKH